jgi:hypothetical protein
MAQDWFAANAPQAKAQPQAATQNWFATNAPAQQPAEQQGFASSFADTSGLSMIAHALMHPVDAAKAMIAPYNPFSTKEDLLANPMVGAGVNTVQEVRAANEDLKSGNRAGAMVHSVKAIPIVGQVMDKASDQYGDKNYMGEAGTLLGFGASVVGPKVLEGVVSAVRNVPASVRRAAAGPNLDRPIPGEPVTPRQQFQIAKDQGVNLDAAQATDSPALSLAKKVTDSSLGGAAAYQKNFGENVKALQMHAQELLDKASPVEMSREQFGNTAKQALQGDLAAKQAEAGTMFDELTQSAGPTQPPVKGIRAQAQKIVAENQGYYDKHPDMLTGIARRAWTIVKNLADAPAPGTPEAAQRPADTWSDLHMLRTDLMDLTRSPEIAGNRPEGWLKLMTGAVDDSMSKGALDLSKGDYQKWRDANDLYTQIKSTYDNPQHPLYSAIRQPDGLTVANQVANLKPAIARQFVAAAPDLEGQLQRQTIDRMLRPAGNDVPDLKNLPTRYTRAQKEQLSGILSPSQMVDLENLSRTSRMVHATDNASGTAIKGQAVGEASAIGAGLLKAGVSLVSGNPVGVAEGLAPVGWYGVTKAASRAMTNPGTVDNLMRPAPPPRVMTPIRGSIPASTAAVAGSGAKGQDRWAELGAAKLADHLSRETKSEISADDIAALKRTPQGQQLLIQASDLDPGSTAMRNLVKQIQALQ